MKTLFSNDTFNNILWFGVSIVAAFFIWVIATFQVDPIVVQRLPQQVTVQILTDSGLLITNNPRETVFVTVRGQQSVISAITTEDITVRADLTGLGPGDHTIPLEALIAGDRQAVIEDISPRQLRIVLEEVNQQFVNVQAELTDTIPVGYQTDAPIFDSTQVLVSGAASDVVRVVAAQAPISLANRRNSFQETVRLVPIDAEGVAVMGLSLDPAQVTVTVTVRQRDDILEVAVTPNILIDDLPDGYRLSSITYSPQTILVGGSPELLQNIPNTLFTESVELAGHITSFDVTVPVILPNDELLVLSQQTITVSIGIAALETTARFDDVPVGTIGAAQGLTTHLVPSTVTVLLTGSQPLLDGLDASDIQVLLDLNGLTEGNYQLMPTVSVNGVEISADNISVLPAEIDISIINPALITETATSTITSTPTPTETESATPRATATP